MAMEATDTMARDLLMLSLDTMVDTMVDTVVMEDTEATDMDIMDKFKCNQEFSVPNFVSLATKLNKI